MLNNQNLSKNWEEGKKNTECNGLKVGTSLEKQKKAMDRRTVYSYVGKGCRGLCERNSFGEGAGKGDGEVKRGLETKGTCACLSVDGNDLGGGGLTNLLCGIEESCKSKAQRRKKKWGPVAE